MRHLHVLTIRRACANLYEGTAAAAVILIVSDGADVHEWSPITPSVYLAILSVAANTLLGFAVAEGLVILFWRTILQGSTVCQSSLIYD